MSDNRLTIRDRLEAILESIHLIIEWTDGRKTYYLSDEREDMQPVPLPSAVRQLWQTLLTYSWQKTDTIQLPRNQLAFLEHLLYSYVEELSGRQLKCRKLIEEGKKV